MSSTQKFHLALIFVLASAPGLASAQELLRVDFERSDLGSYDRAEIASDWASQSGWSVRRTSGTEDLSIVTLDGNRVLQSFHRAGLAGGSNGGSFSINFPRSYDDLYMSFRVRFAEGYTFTLGGKMPRLRGGTIRACVPPTGDAFSAAVTWGRNGDASDTSYAEITSYVYHIDQPNACGQGRRNSVPAIVVPGRWYTVEARVTMNTPGTPNGAMRIWIDGVMTYERSRYRFRNDTSLAIDNFQFKAAFGGPNVERWRTVRDERVYYDDFVISTERRMDRMGTDAGVDSGLGAMRDAGVDIGFDSGPGTVPDAGAAPDAAVVLDARVAGDAEVSADDAGLSRRDAGGGAGGGCGVVRSRGAATPAPWLLFALWLFRKPRTTRSSAHFNRRAV